MTSKTRKRIWPVALMSLAVFGVLAAVVAFSAMTPQASQAHGCTTGTLQEQAECIRDHVADGLDHMDDTHDHMDSNGNGNGDDTMAKPVVSSSNGGSSTVELKLTLEVPAGGVPVGGAFVLYLEDDFQEPDSISASDVYFVSMPPELVTGNGSRVYATVNPEIETDSHFTADKKDIDIRVSVPDMCANNETECEGANGLMAGDTVTMVIQKSAGIKNPSEAGSHSTGYAILGSTDNVPSGPSGDGFVKANELPTERKITLFDVDNKRGFEQTITGSGFKDGTTASVYVLHIMGTEPVDADDAEAVARRNAYLWNALDCAEMVDAVGDATMEAATSANPYCEMYAGLGPDEKVVVGELDFSKGAAEAQLCAAIIRDGTEVGGALVGSDDKVAVTFEVTAPTFGPGQTNHICMADGTGNASITDVEDFNLQPSIKVVPSSANSGDTVNVFAQDFSNTGADHSVLKIAGRDINSSFIDDDEDISIGGDGSVTFEVPGGFEGTLRIDAGWCTSGDPPVCITKDSKITIGGADLNVSKTEVLPNETVTINGNGFGSQTCIDPSDITLDGVPVNVHDDSIDNDSGCVEVSNAGQFVATIIIWPDDADSDGTNPTLIPGTHTLDVEDDEEYAASINLTIADPSISVTPDVAGPRDYVTVTGMNWAVDNLDSDERPAVMVTVEDGRTREYQVQTNAVGRFTVEHRVDRRVAIPSTVQVKANYGQGRVVQIASFAVPASVVEVTPGEGQPGDTVTLTASNMPVYTTLNYVAIGGTKNEPGINTDRDGNITVEDVLIPGLDPGVYSVVINVADTIAIGEINVLAESSAAGAPAELPGAVESLGDSLVAIFHFDDVGKEWSFYDPRPEFADLNTLTEMVNGEAYWILVSETVDDVVLNNKVRSLTCRGSDCWNLEVW